MSREAAVKRYHSAHWGIPHTREFRVQDPDLRVGALTELGKLRELQIKPDGRGATFGISFPENDRCILAFTPDKWGHLCLVYPLAVQAEIRREYVLPDADGGWYDVRKVAAAAGGQQAEYPRYPVGLFVQVLGKLEAIVYLTGKLDDVEQDHGLPSEYIHEFGDLTESTGELGYVGVDEFGRLWILGGAYTTPDDGITG